MRVALNFKPSNLHVLSVKSFALETRKVLKIKN